MNNRPLTIVIVNWNSGEQLKECISSVVAYSAGVVRETIVVDNGSSDDSALGITDFPGVTLIAAQENLGFAKGCNLGARSAQTDYILFLNPDAAICEDTLPDVVAFMDNPMNEHVGICGVQLFDESGAVSRTCARFPKVSNFVAQAIGLDKISVFRSLGFHMTEWNHAESRRVDQVIGAFFFVRRAVFSRLAGFDERFFVYFEEVDFAYRAHLLNWRCAYIAESRAFHLGGGASRQVKAKRLFYSVRSRLLYGFKHFSSLKAWTLVCVTLLLEPFSRILHCTVRGDFQGVRNTLLGFGYVWRQFPAILKAAKIPDCKFQ